MVSEREKMIAGELYNAQDPELVAARTRARDLCWTLNASRENDTTVRRQICQDLLATGGDEVWIQPPFYCDYGWNIYLGKQCYFNFNCVVLDVAKVTIGDHVFCGPNVQIYAATHPLDPVVRRTLEYGRPVTIGNDVWIGGGAIICPGVTIGDRSVIGAGSVVTKEIPPGVLAVGNPCKVIREIAS